MPAIARMGMLVDNDPKALVSLDARIVGESQRSRREEHAAHTVRHADRDQ